MAATIKIKNSSTASAVPTSSDLVQGELAVNVTDKRVFTENASGTVVELGTNPSILTLPDGSASAPTLTNDGDTNTGIFFPAADTVGITTGGTERARVDSSGNLGVGTSSPAQRLHLAQAGQPKIEFEDTTNTSKGRITTGGSTGSMTFDADPDNAKAGTVMTFNVDASERMRLDASGNLGIGTTSPATQLHLSSATPPVIRLQTDTTSSAYGVNWYYTSSASVKGALTLNLGAAEMRMSVGESGNSYFQTFYTNGSERARIDSSGNLLVGTTSADIIGANGDGFTYRPASKSFSVNATSSAPVNIGRSTSSGTLVNFFYNASVKGTISTDGSTTAYNTSSDYRLKEDIQPMTGALAKVAALKPCTYKWKANGSDGEGFIAHELQEVVAGCVTGEKDAVDEDGNPVYQGIDTSFLVATLTAAIQEQQAIITQLQADVAALKG